VAREVRVFPLLELGALPSRYREPVVAQLSAEGYDVQIRRVPYEFQKQGNEMLMVSVP
jgi:branched-subunit amino acid aminotransferase/4-amino-4-deoxychorismate lyase